MSKNYYIVLGVPSKSTPDEIKRAYRQLAKRYHPDYFGSDNLPFQRIQEAYSVLSDPVARKKYDHRLGDKPGGARKSFRRKVPVEPMNPEKGVFQSLNTAPIMQAHSHFRRHPSPFDKRLQPEDITEPHSSQTRIRNVSGSCGRNLNMSVEISEAQAYYGGEISLRVPIITSCPACSRYSSSIHRYCLLCDGNGIIHCEYPLYIELPRHTTEHQTIEVELNPFGFERCVFTLHVTVVS